jgi:hypothetical protein
MTEDFKREFQCHAVPAADDISTVSGSGPLRSLGDRHSAETWMKGQQLGCQLVIRAVHYQPILPVLTILYRRLSEKVSL